MFASHVWWLVIGSVWLTDDRFVRIITLIALDNLTLPPLFMAMILRLLQDRRRPLWPVFVAATPTAVFAVIGITTRYEMIITSLSGLYRHKTHKIITVVGRYHGIPTVIIEK